MSSGPSRRRLLQAGLLTAGAGAATTVPISMPSAYAEATVTGSPRFTIAVIPDTQYLFDGDRGDRRSLVASLRHLIEHRRAGNVVFVRTSATSPRTVRRRRSPKPARS